jgi:hypothetical protein
VPVVYSLLRRKAPETHVEPELSDPSDPYAKFIPHDDGDAEPQQSQSQQQNPQVAHAS